MTEQHTLFLTIGNYGETLELACTCGWSEELGAQDIGPRPQRDYGTLLTAANEAAQRHVSATDMHPE